MRRISMVSRMRPKTGRRREEGEDRETERSGGL